MKKTIKPLLLVGYITFMIHACSKDTSSNNNTDHETQTTTDNLLAESISNEVTTVTTQSEDNGAATSLYLSPCAKVTMDFATSLYHLTIDYGKTNCLCLDGKYRRGKILVTFTGFYRDSGSTHTVGFDNYYVNDYKVDGSQTIINKGHNTAGNIIFSVSTDGTLTDTAGSVLTFKSERQREWIAGENTAGLNEWQDDVYSITGTASGVDFSGKAYTAEITKPLICALSCNWIEAGQFDFKPDGELKRSIDFGNGGCDNKASVTIAGFTLNITLE